MSRRPLLPLAVAALVLALGAGCAKDVSPAARIGGTKISDTELIDEVGEWAHNEAAFDQEQLKGLNPGTYPMELVNVILQQRIDLDLHNQEFDRLELKLTDDARAAAVTSLFQGDTALAQQALGGFTKDYATTYVDDIARQFAVEQTLGQQGYIAWRNKAYTDADVEVSARYGHWDPKAQAVVAPEGPTAASSGLVVQP